MRDMTHSFYLLVLFKGRLTRHKPEGGIVLPVRMLWVEWEWLWPRMVGITKMATLDACVVW